MIDIPMNEQAVTVLMENGPGDTDVKAFIMQKDNDYPPRIVVAYQILDLDGNEIDAGIEGPENGSEVIPDENDIIYGETSVSLAIKILKGSYATEPSSSSFHPGIWYTSEDSTDYKTGKVTSRSYHLRGFMPEQEREIYNAIVGKK
jgi:hypothetical protein